MITLSCIFVDKFKAPDLALASDKARADGHWVQAWRGHVESGELAGVEALLDLDTNKLLVTIGVGGVTPTTIERTWVDMNELQAFVEAQVVVQQVGAPS